MPLKFLNGRRVDCKSYQGRVPFPHTIIDGLFVSGPCRAVAQSIPSLGPRWCAYDSPLERKWVLNDRTEEAEPIRALYETLGDDGFLDLLEQVTELEGLTWDQSLWAAGICVAERGGKLDLHRDALTHPHLPLERALTAVLFLTDEWEEDWGGALEFWSERDGAPFTLEQKIVPKLGRLVLFDPNGFHGYPDPIVCPEGITRQTVQVFYWRERTTNEERPRAVFAPRPGEAESEELSRLRAERAQLPQAAR